MIVRILSEGQWELDAQQVDALNEFDKRVEAAVVTDDQAALSRALEELNAAVRGQGRPVSDDALVESDLVLPASDATMAEIRALFDEQTDGLIPG